MIGDNGRLTAHFMGKQEFNRALDALSQIEDSDIRCSLLSKYSSSLIRGSPGPFLDLLQHESDQINNLNKRSLTAALTRTPASHLEQAYKFVRGVSAEASESETFFGNLALYLCVEWLGRMEDVEKVIGFKDLVIFIKNIEVQSMVKVDLEKAEFDMSNQISLIRRSSETELSKAKLTKFLESNIILLAILGRF